MADFNERVRLLCIEAGFRPSIDEDELSIAEVSFTLADSTQFEIVMGGGNRKSRMWLEHQLLRQFQGIGTAESPWEKFLFLMGDTSIDDLRSEGETFFGADIWNKASSTEHTFVYGLKIGTSMTVRFKDDVIQILGRRLIEDAWQHKEIINTESEGAWRCAVYCIFEQLNQGTIRSATLVDGAWVPNELVKKAILLYFKGHANDMIDDIESWDKVPLKCNNWDYKDFEDASFRLVPGAIVRDSAYIAPGVVLMANSFVNVGAYVGMKTMIDTGARVGSCAQVGANVHLGAGSGVGGVLEPMQAKPTVIEDDVFISAMCEVAEGTIVRRGAVLGMGTNITASTRIVDRTKVTIGDDGYPVFEGAITYGEVPENAVVVPGTYPDPKTGIGIACAVIVKYADASTRKKTSINDLLRD